MAKSEAESAVVAVLACAVLLYILPPEARAAVVGMLLHGRDLFMTLTAGAVR